MFEFSELGHFALLLAFGLSFAQIFISGWTVINKDLRSLTFATRITNLVFALVSFAFIALIYAFLNNDFTLQYVALNSNTHLDWYYKISASWAGHEGSLLLWVWCLSMWSFLLVKFSKELAPAFKAKVIGVLSVVIFGFLSFIIFTSNPFTRLLATNDLSAPIVGKDLNPMLQDIGLILHPPLLYMGYVGFAVSFAFIVSALIEGRLDSQWAKLARPWTMGAWSFLTLGIALGSWWAYYELGWGGWWFWDPVENSSLMPWLLGTALVHSLVATEKRNVFKIWTAFLAIATFSLSLIGTFLVRSGVLTSVHAFASDPTRGIYILVLLGIISGSAFLLLILRANKLQSIGNFSFFSREFMLLINNLILSMACLIVFVGTLTPLFYEVVGWEKISIGAPYFNAKMLWVLVVALVCFTFAPYVNWKNDRIKRLLPWSVSALFIGLIGSYFSISQFDKFDNKAFILLTLTITAIFLLFIELLFFVKKHKKLPPFASFAMVFGHLGFLIAVVGIILAGTYSIEKDMYVKNHETIKLQNYSFETKSIHKNTGKQYDDVTIDFLLRDKNQKVLATLRPEKRNYHIARMPISESAILPSVTKDIYMALGEEQKENEWSVRVQIKPFIRWVWFGGLVMALASLFVTLRPKNSRKNK